MVVGSDSVHMKEYSSVNQKLAENTNCQDSDILYSSGTFLYNNVLFCLIQNKIQNINLQLILQEYYCI